MAVFKCKMCGGDLNITDSAVVAVCEYCETRQTIPQLDNEKKLNLFNRANRLRMHCEFDKAASIYESIIAEFPEEPESYWGLCLCNYGIEYVDDPLTGKKIPTCHRASFESLQKDENFSLALEYADILAQKVYRDEAREIDRIMEEILSVSRNEKPYDVFICYKEKDENGDRTIDSVLAQDIYDALTGKGLNVFFARITLEDKLGTAYEPYIFAALNSAKVMLAVGTRFEYFNAVWVKNEWSRFLKIIAKDKSKVLIPCFKDIDAYDLPDEFKMLQAQDMGKIGANQDLVRGVEKILGVDMFSSRDSIRSQQEDLSVDNFIKRGNLYITVGDFQNAQIYFDKALDFDPENVNANLGMLLVQKNAKTIADLKFCAEDLEQSVYYKFLMNFADQKTKTELQMCNQVILTRNKEVYSEQIYNQALLAMNSAMSKSDFENAAELFSKIMDYKDSEQLFEKSSTEWNRRVLIAEKALEDLKKYSELNSAQKVTALKISELINKETELNNKINEVESIANEVTELMQSKEQIKLKVEELVEINSSRGIFAIQQKKQNNQKILDYRTQIERISEGILAKTSYINSLEAENLEDKLNIIRQERAKLEYRSEKEKTDAKSWLEIIKDSQSIILTYEYFITVAENTDVITVLSSDKEFLYQFLMKYSEINIRNFISELFKCKSIQLVILNYFPIMRFLIKNKTLFNMLSPKMRLNIQIKVSDQIYFGSYTQNDNKSYQPIEWVVLGKDDKKALLFSRYCLDCLQFNSSKENYVIHWANSEIRKWLNIQFFNKAFTSEEQSVVLDANLTNPSGPSSYSRAGSNTVDKVFLLSCAEVDMYLKNSPLRSGFLTKYALAKYPDLISPKKDVSWWLRTSGDGVCNAYTTSGNSNKKLESTDPTTLLYMKMAGDTSFFGNLAYHINGVRPAILVDLTV